MGLFPRARQVSFKNSNLIFKLSLSQYASNYEYPTSFALSNVKCPRGWIPYHTSCYKLYNQPMDFDSANDQCSKDKPSGANYATLITGWDEYEILFMSTFLRDDQLPNRSPSDLPDGYWIGVKNMENRYGSKSFQFVDGWPMTYTKYAGNGDAAGDCIFMRPDGKWDNTYCNSAKVHKLLLLGATMYNKFLAICL